MKSRIMAGAVTAGLLCVGAASASTYGIVDLATGGDATGIGSTIGSFDNGAISGSMTALTGLPLVTPILTQSASGVGVSEYTGDDPAIDGEIFWEAIVFNFGWTVKMISVTIGALDSEDDYDVWADGSFVHNGDTSTFYFDDPTYVTSFGVSANDTFECEADAWMCFFGLASGGPDDVTVKSFEVSSVPVPASGLLLAGLIGGLGFQRGRRKAS